MYASVCLLFPPFSTLPFDALRQSIPLDLCNTYDGCICVCAVQIQSGMEGIEMLAKGQLDIAQLGSPPTVIGLSPPRSLPLEVVYTALQVVYTLQIKNA